LETNHLTGPKKYKGYALLIMLLLVVVIGALAWLDPFKLVRSNKDKSLPWNQERSIVPEGKTVPELTEQQPKFTTYMGVTAECKENKEDRGQVDIRITPEGRVVGSWFADYSPEPELRYEVVRGSFKGNIDPKRLYTDKNGKEPSKLYIISKGNFLILETKKGLMRTVKGKVYATGWVDNEYNITGKVTITSDKKTYYEYEFAGKLTETPPFPYELYEVPEFQGIPLPKMK
jgi:hypothetical protein